MRKLIYHMSVSLDGYAEGPGGDLSWSTPSPELHSYFNALDASLDGQIYGRGLYELMSAFWPTADQDPTAPPEIVEYARVWRAQHRFVFSNSLKEVGWNSTLVRGDLPQEIMKLKQQPGNALGLGGPTLAHSVMRLGLVDEIGMYIHPVLLGGGKRLLPDLPEPLQLHLVETRQFPQGVVLLRYGVTNA